MSEIETFTPDEINRLYHSIYRIRRVEEEIAKIYPTDKIKSPVHLSIGQEAVSVGVCEALTPTDVIFGTYRGHAAYLAKGGDLKQMLAELFGKVTGCARGKGGSMHLVDVKNGMMGTSAVVATTIPNAVGFALTLKFQRKQSFVVSFFGDGATEEGVFWESLNFAQLHQLPILFVCENNKYAIHTEQKRRQAVGDITKQVRSFGLPAECIEDNDLFAIYSWTRRVASSLRAHQIGPRFLECLTYRWGEHVGPNDDFDLGYRSQDEARKWINNDQVKIAGAKLSDEMRIKIEEEVDGEITRAVAFAEDSPFPDDEELYHHLFMDA